MVGLLGFSGYYLASFLDFAGLAYISAGLERLILYLNPTLVLALGALTGCRFENASPVHPSSDAVRRAEERRRRAGARVAPGARAGHR